MRNRGDDIAAPIARLQNQRGALPHRAAVFTGLSVDVRSPPVLRLPEPALAALEAAIAAATRGDQANPRIVGRIAADESSTQFEVRIVEEL